MASGRLLWLLRSLLGGSCGAWGASWTPLGGLLGSPWGSHGGPRGLPWDPLGPHGDPMGIPWGSHGGPMGPFGPPWGSHGPPMGIPWAFYGPPMTLPWVPMGPHGPHDPPMGLGTASEPPLGAPPTLPQALPPNPVECLKFSSEEALVFRSKKGQILCKISIFYFNLAFAAGRGTPFHLDFPLFPLPSPKFAKCRLAQRAPQPALGKFRGGKREERKVQRCCSATKLCMILHQVK